MLNLKVISAWSPFTLESLKLNKYLRTRTKGVNTAEEQIREAEYLHRTRQGWRTAVETMSGFM